MALLKFNEFPCSITDITIALTSQRTLDKSPLEEHEIVN